jgi:hypothetical protein
MKDCLQKQGNAHGYHSNRELVEGLQKALEKNYGRILRAAGKEWERRFAGKDPSDACVSVRISSWGRALSGFSNHDRRALSSFHSQTA